MPSSYIFKTGDQGIRVFSGDVSSTTLKLVYADASSWVQVEQQGGSMPNQKSVNVKWADPTKIDRATADTLRRIASSKEVVTPSSANDGPTMLVPPETLRTIGASALGSTQLRSMPLVSISESA